MSQHPSDTVLFECATHEDADVMAHVRGCNACTTRFARLRAGASIIDAVRRESAPPVDWRSMDARILAAAESAASDIRKGTLRAPRRIHAPVYIGVALAAAAAGVFMLRTSTQSHVAPEVAITAPAQSGSESPTHVPAVHPLAAPESGEAFVGRVILVAAPVSYAAAGVEPAPLSATTELRQGTRISADDHGGRAVVALHAGYRVDARPGTDLTLARLSTTDTTLGLAKGEARIDGPAMERGRVAVEARGWTLLAKGGGFIAKLEGDVVRLRVMSGKVGVAREGVAEREANAGEEIELSGTGYRVLSHQARDADEIDGSLLASDGTVVNVPHLSDRMQLSVAGHGTLPAGLTAIRTRSPLALQAQVGDENWTLTADPSAPPDSVGWRRANRVAPARPAATGAGSNGSTAGSAVAPGVGPAMVIAEPTTPPRYAARVTADALGTWRGYTQTVSESVAACIDGCTASNTCPSAPSISIHIEPNANGSSAVRVSGISDAIARCVRARVEALSVPAGYRGQGQLVTLSRQ